MKIKKAVFPVAGFGTRFLPATKAMPKELLPVVDKPLIQYALEIIIIILLFFIFKIVGLKISRNVSGFLFKNFGSFFRSKKTSRANLSIAIPNFNEMQKDKILANMWINYGKIFAEYMFIKKFRISKKFSNQMIIQNQDEPLFCFDE